MQTETKRQDIPALGKQLPQSLSGFYWPISVANILYITECFNCRTDVIQPRSSGEVPNTINLPRTVSTPY